MHITLSKLLENTARSQLQAEYNPEFNKMYLNKGIRKKALKQRIAMIKKQRTCNPVINPEKEIRDMSPEDSFRSDLFKKMVEKYQEKITQEHEKRLVEILAGGSLGDWDSTVSAAPQEGEASLSFLGCVQITGA